MMRKFLYYLILFFCLEPLLFAVDTQTEKYTAEDKKLPDLPNISYINQDKKWNMSSYKLPWIVMDSNRDGTSDVATKVSSNGYKKSVEVLDSNFDGIADDFAFFDEHGQMIFQEIDSNHDRKIDLWVTIEDGKYMKRFQRDKNFDGYIDIDRTFK